MLQLKVLDTRLAGGLESFQAKMEAAKLEGLIDKSFSLIMVELICGKINLFMSC